MRTLPVFFLLSACSLAAPLDGPQLDDRGAAVSTEGPVLAVVTHARIASGAGKRFDEHVQAISDQLEQQPGFIGSSLRAKLGTRERWTLTVWEDEVSMMEFVVSGAHLAALSETGEVIDGVRPAHWELDANELPIDWSTALDHLEGVPDAW